MLEAGPDVLNHNIETVPRLYSRVRPGAGYQRSLELLSRAASRQKGSGQRQGNAVLSNGRSVVTKSGLMVGLGETDEELARTLRDLRDANVEILTVGQYLSPTREHHPVIRFMPPEEFAAIEEQALGLGFAGVACGPFVRSSYQADRLFAQTSRQALERT